MIDNSFMLISWDYFGCFGAKGDCSILSRLSLFFCLWMLLYERILGTWEYAPYYFKLRAATRLYFGSKKTFCYFVLSEKSLSRIDGKFLQVISCFLS
jgi:hypothetical protein